MGQTMASSKTQGMVNGSGLKPEVKPTAFLHCIKMHLDFFAYVL